MVYVHLYTVELYMYQSEQPSPDYLQVEGGYTIAGAGDAQLEHARLN